MIKRKNIIAVMVVILLVTGLIFLLQGKKDVEPTTNIITSQKKDETDKEEMTSTPEETSAPTSTPHVSINPVSTELPRKYEEAPQPEYSLGEEKNTVKVPESVAQECTVAIYCNTLLNNINLLDAKKRSLVPADGCILAEYEVEIEDGDSVFDALKKATKENKIHLEFVNTPIYNSAYIEGLNNIYEFDAGELSGWMYSVNGEFPNYGSSRYKIKAGDRIEWHYSCDLGKDVSGKQVSQKEE